MKVVVLGAEGQLGREICRQLGPSGVGLGHEQLDITDSAAVCDALQAQRPAVVINAAAYTAVDRAEHDVVACSAVNAVAVEHLTGVCQNLQCTLVQISTDYVFGSSTERRGPYHETDPPAPQGVYARTKLAGEQAAAAGARHFVIRTCGLYGPRHKAGQTNFVDTMLRLAGERDSLRVVDDQQCTPSYVVDVAQAIRFLLGTTAYGTYHVVNAGSATWYGFAAEIFRQAGVAVQLERITTAEYGAAAPRPRYSVLDTGKYRALGGPALRPWQEALAAYLATLGYPRA